MFVCGWQKRIRNIIRQLIQEITMSEPAPQDDLSDWKMPGGFEVDGVQYGKHPFSPEAIRKIKEGDVPDFDVLIATFPRAGTARLIEICWLLTHDCDVEGAKSIEAIDKHMYLEVACTPGWEPTDDIRLAKTHLDFDTSRTLVGKNPKIVVGFRNPKDLLTSFFHFNKMAPILGQFPGNWRQFMECYKKKVFEYGDYFDNVLSWWAERNRDNILIVFYEDLNKDPYATVKKINDHLGTNHCEAKLNDVLEWIAFENIKEQPMANFESKRYEGILDCTISPYMRTGVIGDWKNYFTDEDNAYIDGMCKTRCEPVGLKFQFE